MDGWELTAFRISKTVVERTLYPANTNLPNYGGQLAVSFVDFAGVDLSDTSLYFKAPDAFLRNQVFSYGGNVNYELIYSGYEFDGETL